MSLSEISVVRKPAAMGRMISAATPAFPGVDELHLGLSGPAPP
jgi:hypothetical protein